MKFMEWADDGGAKSGVRGFFLVEIKSLFSVVVLRFDPGTREAHHSHAFNALTLWLNGSVSEHLLNDPSMKMCGPIYWRPFQFKITRRSTFHQVRSHGVSWALSFRGPWSDTWQEYRNGTIVTLTHGRHEVRE